MSPNKNKREDFSRLQAQKDLMGYTEKKAFTIKNNVRETRFTKKDLEDLKKRFEKNSQWVLVNAKGEAFKDEDCNDADEPSIEIHNEDDIIKGSGSRKLKQAQPLKKQDQTYKILPNKQKKVKISLDGKIDFNSHQPHLEQRMSKQQFREQMGLLGLESNAFLSDRIFEVVDNDHDEFISFIQFCTIMDTLINGDEDEKQEFSFSLIEGKMGGGYFDFKEFCDFINKIIAHWCIMTGSSVSANKEQLKDIFNKMGPVNGVVDIVQYKNARRENPQLFQWFDLLNQKGYVAKEKKPDNSQVDEFKKQAAQDIMALIDQITQLKSQVQEYEQTSQMLIANADKSVQSSVISQFDMSQIPKQNFQYDSNGDQKAATMTNQQLQSAKRKVSVSGFNSPSRPLSKRNSFRQQESMSYHRRDSEKRKHNSESNQRIEGQDKLYLKFKYLLNPDPDLAPRSPKIQAVEENLEEKKFAFYNNNPHLEKDSLASSFFKENIIDHFTYESNSKFSYLDRNIIESMREQKEFTKQIKKQIGEKKAHMEQIRKKYDSQSSDSDMIEDPESEEDKVEQLMPVKKFEEDFSSPLPTNQRIPSQVEEIKKGSSDRNMQQIVGSFKSQRSQVASSGMKSDLQQAFGQKFRSRGMNSHNNNFGFIGNTGGKQMHTMSSDRETSPALTYEGSRSDAQGGPIVERFNRQKESITEKEHSQFYQHFNIKEGLSSEMNGKSDHSKSSPGGGYKDYQRSPTQKLSEKSQLQGTQLMEKLNQLTQITSTLQQKFIDGVIQPDNIDYLKPIKEGSQELFDDKRLGSLLQDFQSISDFEKGFTQKKGQSSSGGKEKRPSSSKKKKSIHKPLAKKSSNKSFIHFAHDNWNLVLHMMMGVRQSVRNVMHEEFFDITDLDFQRKYSYELTAKKTKNMRLFEFFDFSPRVFHRIRMMYGITPDSYLKSIGPENLIGNLLMGNISSLKEQCSTGKSGSFFYYTADSRFMLKTISHQEFTHLKLILRDYFEHVSTYQHTLITRFLGLHKIKYTKKFGKMRVYFVIMANVFNTQREINVRYDLKGSTQGRQTKKNLNESVDPAVALKDLDFVESKEKIYVSKEVKQALIKQIQADVHLFQRLNINDYSLLLGIHYIGDDEDPQDILKNSAHDIQYLVKQALNSGLDVENYRKSFIYSANRKGGSKQGGGVIPFYEANDGGILSLDQKCIYFLGIIDTLTVFEIKKKLEYHFKSIRYGYGNKISCIPPHQYGERFFEFISQIFVDEIPSSNYQSHQ